MYGIVVRNRVHARRDCGGASYKIYVTPKIYFVFGCLDCEGQSAVGDVETCTVCVHVWSVIVYVCMYIHRLKSTYKKLYTDAILHRYS